VISSLQVFRQKFRMHFLSLPCVLPALPISSALKCSHVMKLLIMQCSPASRHLAANIKRKQMAVVVCMKPEAARVRCVAAVRHVLCLLFACYPCFWSVSRRLSTT
jgi:hypothetical protein